MKQLIIFFDGSCEPVNPNGNIGIGVVVYEAENFKFNRDKKQKSIIWSSYDSLKKIHEYSNKYDFGSSGFEITSNNMAEHLSLGYALRWLEHREENEVFVFGDSQLAINQITGVYSINRGKIYYDAADKAIQALSKIHDTKKIKFEWIPREYNSVADALSTKGHSEIKDYSK